MPKRVSPAQRVFQITFVLKGDLKNIQIAIVRAAARLAQVRDQKLYRVIGHDSMEEYAAERLGLQRAMLYRYLQIYDWLRKWHPEWLARRPKGFIPDLNDLYALIWIEGRLRDPDLGAATRAALEAMRKKALAGKLTKREFEEFRSRGRKRRDSLQAVAASLRSLRRRLDSLDDLPAGFLTDFDALLGRLKSASGAVASLVRLANARAIRISAFSEKSLPG
jgi:hypothetical protein